MKKRILIIGGGAAGLSAAVTAAEMGAEVCVLERLAKTGGNGQFAEGVFGAGSRLQRRLNIEAEPARIFKEAMEYSHWRADARLTRELIEASGETVDWLTALGVPFCRVIHHMVNQSPEVFHMTDPGPSGKVVMEVLARHCAQRNIVIETGVRVRELLLDDRGAVCGAVGEKEGESLRYEAENVLIATGGMAGNPELVKRLKPDFQPEKYMHFKGVYHPGDGAELAEQVGAALEGDIAIEGAGPVFCGPGPVGALVRCTESIWVNILGERFADESICDDFIFGQNAVARQPEKRCFAIFDEGTIRRLMDAPPSVMAPASATDSGFAGLPEAVERALARGELFRADSIEALAEAAGLDPATLGETVREYNEFCRLGEDKQLSKPRRCLYALENGPYYAAPAGIDMITTHGGIRVNHRLQVVSENGRPIPGLWAAGIDISGIDSGDYSVTLSGHAFGFSLAGGRMAVKNILK